MSRVRVAFALLLVVGCDRGEKVAPPSSATPPTPSLAPSASAPAQLAKDALLVERPRTQVELPTTEGEAFLANLAGQVVAAKQRVATLKTSPTAAVMAASLMASQGKINGKLGQLAEALEIVETALKTAPKDAKLLAQHAELCAALHLFPKAEQSAKQAHEIAPSPETRALLADAAWARGDHEVGIREIRAIAKEHPRFGSVVRLAQLELDLGNVEAAEREFARAETLIIDVSPVPVAWLNVQRGLLGLDTGQFEKAERFYREAVARLPKYPMAVEHLAEIEGLLGKREEAVRRYKQVVEDTNDPELIGALAGLLEESGQADEAKALTVRAKARYEELLAAHPEAMYWHAAGFFSDQGDTKKALDLLQKNLKLRPSPTSHAALAAAELAAGKVDAAAKRIDEVLKSPVRRADLFWTAAKIKKAQGQTKEAAELEKKARALNPKIEVLEGPL